MLAARAIRRAASLRLAPASAARASLSDLKVETWDAEESESVCEGEDSICGRRSSEACEEVKGSDGEADFRDGPAKAIGSDGSVKASDGDEAARPNGAGQETDRDEEGTFGASCRGRGCRDGAAATLSASGLCDASRTSAKESVSDHETRSTAEADECEAGSGRAMTTRGLARDGGSLLRDAW